MSLLSTLRSVPAQGLHSLEGLYPYTPLWIQNLGISLYGIAYRRERLGRGFANQVREFKDRDRWSVDEMQAYLMEKLREVLARAFVHVPFYRRAWRSLGITLGDLARFQLEDLASLPITTKGHLRSHPDEFIDSDVARTQQLHRYYTSGSTGTPISCVLTSEAHRRVIAAREARSFGWAGVSILWPRSTIGGRLVTPRADSPPPYYRYNWAERQVYFSTFHISPDRAANYVEGFNRYRPRVLTGYAYSHYALARMMLERGLCLSYRPDALVLSAEKLTPQMKSVIQEAFQARAYEEYGTVEQCVLATECESGRLHVNPDFGIVELLDESGKPTRPGQEGRITCTSLVSDAQPLIRYEIGDLGVWSKETCPCGRNHLPVLKEILGRLEDAVVGQDGRELVRFHGLFIAVPNLVEAQLVQEKRDLLRVRLVVNEGFGEKEENLIRERLCTQRLGKVQVIIERVQQLERSESGKFRAVVSRLSKKEGNDPFVRVGD